MSSPSIEIRFGGHLLVLDGGGALYWPSERILVVSDLHLEKSTYLAAYGSLIAPYDTHDTLDRLEALITRYEPQELILLGDSFHDRHAWARLDDYSRERILALSDKVARCSWIEGNHDVTLIGHELMAFHTVREISGLVFSHEPIEHNWPQLVGHFHPKVSFGARGAYVKGPCFAHTDTLFIMPAFGSFTGGLDIGHEAFQMLAQSAVFQPYLIHRKSVFKVPVKRPSTKASRA